MFLARIRGYRPILGLTFQFLLFRTFWHLWHFSPWKKILCPPYLTSFFDQLCFLKFYYLIIKKVFISEFFNFLIFFIVIKDVKKKYITGGTNLRYNLCRVALLFPLCLLKWICVQFQCTETIFLSIEIRNL